ncbi:hypothetical protein [Caldinitratiruptor microaerophilus]|uniref:Uncharacterized protein n=1 Tax=Caldinitratiruptor microaerophilus TaxID=671077 RepID=A0AA35CJF2_9FIRM|nr:hypothetical protein [Caldinitratiruptor microaerophilus]BDG60317.1 hypothetical protein caldi_14070 [Caldinitratiruptor microaerophilus]
MKTRVGMDLILGSILLAVALVLGLSVDRPARAATINVSATLKPKIVLTMPDSAANFGALDPGVAGSDSVAGNVKANVTWTLTYSATDLSDGTNIVSISNMTYQGTNIATPQTFSTLGGTIYSAQPPTPNNGFDFTHTYTLTFPWAAVPSTYTGTVTYTATQ